MRERTEELAWTNLALEIAEPLRAEIQLREANQRLQDTLAAGDADYGNESKTANGHE
jgi:hypothetical protein